MSETPSIFCKALRTEAAQAPQTIPGSFKTTCPSMVPTSAGRSTLATTGVVGPCAVDTGVAGGTGAEVLQPTAKIPNSTRHFFTASLLE